MYRTKMYEKRHPRIKIIDSILDALFEKSKDERWHAENVSSLCAKMAGALKLSQEDTNTLKMAGLVHDIGKIRIEEQILNKNGHLNEQEMFEIRQHPEAGWRILNSVVEYSDTAEFIMTHHEHYDGSGYPHGLKGEAIPLEARIIAIAEAYDMMTTQQSYREALSMLEAKTELLKYAGVQFDPKLVEIFITDVLD